MALATSRRGRSVLALVGVFLLLLSAVSSFAAELLPLTGRVVDNAGMIDAETETAIVARLQAFEAKSSDQIVVATLPTLDGESIEGFANRQFREWKLGQAGENNGVLLLVAKDDRKMRIEVGYGLEGTLTDLHSKLIIENTMVPAFRAGDFAGGVSRAVDDIILVLEGNAAELEARGRRNPADDTIEDWTPAVVSIFIALWIVLFVGGFAFALMASVFGRKLGPNRYRWLGVDITLGGSSYSGGSSGGSWSSGSSSSGGGFSGGGGSSGGGGASGSW